MIEVLWYLLAVLVVIEVGYQLGNLLVKKLNNIAIPNSAESGEEE